MHSYHLEFLDGLQVSFRTEASAERVARAQAYVEKLYDQMAAQEIAGSRKDRLLAVLLIGTADDLLQLRENIDRMEKRLDVILQKVKEDDLGHVEVLPTSATE